MIEVEAHTATEEDTVCVEPQSQHEVVGWVGVAGEEVGVEELLGLLVDDLDGLVFYGGGGDFGAGGEGGKTGLF